MKLHILTKSAYHVRITKGEKKVSTFHKIQLNNKNLKGIKLVMAIIERAGEDNKK
jgi:hypothetical protein